MRLKSRLALIAVLLMSAFIVLHSLLQLRSVAERAEVENDGALPWLMTLLPDRAPPDARSEPEVLDALTELVHRIEGIRHVRVALHAADGRLLAVAPQRERTVPDWLHRWLVKPQTAQRKDVLLRDRPVAYFLVRPAKSDELAEIWEDVISNTLLIVLLSVAAMLLLAGAAFHALRPLDRIRDALQALGEGRRTTLPPTFHEPEIDGIATSFNRMADALDRAQAQRQTLLRRLIDSEELTRRRVAHDLHDELTPYLVALQPLARTLQLQCLTRPDLADIGQTASSLISHQSHVLTTLRRILMGLHPPDLETFGLREALSQMASQSGAPGEEAPRVRLRADGDWQGFGSTLDVSIYRMVQECLTNARRHACPSRIDLGFDTGDRLDDGRPALRITVVNDGVPSASLQVRPGLGTLGMRDRCVALGGSFEAGPDTMHANLWRVTIRLPLDSSPATPQP